MFEVTVNGRFLATHNLRLPDGSTELRHEHVWRVTVTYAGPELDETGMLVDFLDVRGRLEEVLRTCEERHLNDLPAFAERNPSTENVARYLAEQLPQEFPGPACLKSVAVEEEPGCIATYFPPLMHA